MMDQESRHIRRIIAFGLAAIVAVIALRGALALVIGISRPTGVGYYPFFPFFGFGWTGALSAFFFVFWIGSWMLWGWGCGWGGHYPRRYWRYRDASYNTASEEYTSGEIPKEHH